MVIAVAVNNMTPKGHPGLPPLLEHHPSFSPKLQTFEDLHLGDQPGPFSLQLLAISQKVT